MPMLGFGRRERIPETTVTTLTEADVKAAYDRGRRDERARRRRSPLMSLAFGLTAIAGAGLLFFAAKEGSFQRGGAAVDTQLAVASENAAPVLRGAARDTGDKLGELGQTVRNDVSKTGG